MGVEQCDDGDIALFELAMYGMGNDRSFEDFQQWSGFGNKAGIVNAKWGAHSEVSGN